MKKATFSLDDMTLDCIKVIQSYTCNAPASSIVRAAVFRYYEYMCKIHDAGAGAAPQIGGKAQDVP